jgi:hypothetical protein
MELLSTVPDMSYDCMDIWNIGWWAASCVISRGELFLDMGFSFALENSEKREVNEDEGDNVCTNRIVTYLIKYFVCTNT